MITEIQKKHTRLALEQATVKISTSSGFKGTGFFISTDAYILTAWHCIAEIIPMPFSIISVETIDGKSFTAQLDKDKSIQDWDIAVLKIDYSTEYCVPLGLISDENRGDDVIAIGYPAAYIEDRGMGVYDGIINQLLKNSDIDVFETTAIEGQGQSGGLIYHFASQRLIGLAKEIYNDGVTQNTGLALRFEPLFEKWSDLDGINKKVALAWDEYLNKGLKPLTPDKLQAFLEQIPKITADISEVDEHNWPLPVYKTIKRLDQSHRTPQSYFKVFEAFFHLHFVSLASQFYWAFNSQDSSNEDVKAGLAVIYESLLDSECGGSKTWLRRSAILSLACRHLNVKLPELVAILEPDSLSLIKQTNSNQATQDTQADFWFIESGGETWQYLRALVRLQDQLKFYEPLDLDSIDTNEIETQVETLLNTLITIFQAYQGLQLALVAEKTLEDSQQHQVGVHCYWQDDHFLSVTNKRNKRKMQQIWSQVDDDLELLRAPTPPRHDWQWDESLLLFQPQQPYDKYVYLMPLGYRHHHSDFNQDNPVPGLLDSVRWKQQQVASILQRSYQDQESPNWQQAADGSIFKQKIERLVQEICENFAFKPPLIDTLPVYIPPQFDLQHDHFAAQLAEDSVARIQEVERVLRMLKASTNHRLLLEGASGSGKTVLLSQIFQEERKNAVFVSMDAKLAPLEEPKEEKAETVKTNIALRVGMYCLTVLNKLMDLPQPNQTLALVKIQDAIRDNLAYFATKHPQTNFIIVIDGLNQTIDPAGILGALPAEVLDNLYILVSSQPQERVQQPLDIYTQKAWLLADISELAATEAEDIVWYYWDQTISKPIPQRADLPTTLLKRLCQAGNNLPIFLEEWTKGLRELWAADPSQFAKNAEAHFEQLHIGALPEFLRSRLAEVKQDFNPPYLLDALLWCLSLIQKSLTIKELDSAIQALRKQGLLADLPAISKLEIEEALRQSRIGGFVQRRKIGLSEGWQLSHEVLGQWFCEHHGQVEELPKLRLALVPFGAIALPPQASETEIQQWQEWVRNDEHPLDELYNNLSSEQQIGVLDSLLVGLPSQSDEYAQVLIHLVRRFLFGTGEQARAFALQSRLEQSLQSSQLLTRIQADILTALGDIQQKQNQLDQALEYFKRSLALSEQLLKESAIPQNRRDVAIALNRIGDIYRDQNQTETALEYFKRSLALSESSAGF
jgi:tetratricopeptide (TPR) repeat protein